MEAAALGAHAAALGAQGRAPEAHAAGLSRLKLPSSHKILGSREVPFLDLKLPFPTALILWSHSRGNLRIETPCCEGPQRNSLANQPPRVVPGCFQNSACCVHGCPLRKVAGFSPCSPEQRPRQVGQRSHSLLCSLCLCPGPESLSLSLTLSLPWSSSLSAPVVLQDPLLSFHPPPQPLVSCQ